MTSQDRHGALVFRWYRPQAQGVAVVGDFREWDHAGLPMQPEGNGWWSCRGRLEPGIYRFRYLADGQWYLDYASFGLERGPFGWNSVVWVRSACSQEQEADHEHSQEQELASARG